MYRVISPMAKALPDHSFSQPQLGGLHCDPKIPFFGLRSTVRPRKFPTGYALLSSSLLLIRLVVEVMPRLFT